MSDEREAIHPELRRRFKILAGSFHMTSMQLAEMPAEALQRVGLEGADALLRTWRDAAAGFYALTTDAVVESDRPRTTGDGA